MTDFTQFSDGDKVIVSWKEDEGGGWYSNKRKKRGIFRRKNNNEWVETYTNPILYLSDLTSIRPDPTPPSEGEGN